MTCKCSKLLLFILINIFLSNSWFDTLNLNVKLPDVLVTLKRKPYDLDVTQLALNDQEIIYFPNNLGKLFPNLRKMRSTKSKIKNIKRKNFEDMKQLEYLDLSHNSLTSLETDVFYELNNLEELDLYNNTLASLPKKIFSQNVELRKIYASYNRLEALEADIFNENVKLSEIYFDNNRLKKINFRFDSRFSNVYFDLYDNVCTDQALKLLDNQSFIAVNIELEESC